MIVNGIVVYPIYIDELEVADHLSDDEIEEKLLKEADKLFNISTVKPNVHHFRRIKKGGNRDSSRSS